MPYRTPPTTPLGKLIMSAREANIIETEAGVRHAMTQQELADALGSTQQTISRWEAGRVTPPYDKLKRLAEALNVDPQDLIAAAAEQVTTGPPPAPARIETLEERVNDLDSKLDQILTLLDPANRATPARRRLAPVRAAKSKS